MHEIKRAKICACTMPLNGKMDLYSQSTVCEFSGLSKSPIHQLIMMIDDKGFLIPFPRNHEV